MDKATLAEEIAALEARLAQMRAGVASAPSAAPPGDGQVIPRRDSTRARMSFMQEQLWFLDQLSPGHSTYNLSVFLRLTGDLDLGALERAVSAVTARHETLRTTFTVEYGQPWQIVHPPTPVRLPIHDITVAVGEHPQESLRRALERQANEAFRLDRDRPFRFRLYRVAADEHVFGLTAHHICFDGASASVLLTEVSELYGMARAGAELSLPSLPIQYGDLAEWQQQRLADGALERDITYWAEKLANPTTLELPTDRPRPDLPSFRGDRLSYTIPADVLEGMRALSRRVNATLFATLVAGMTATLSRWSATPDVIIGTANGNRQRPEFQSLVGCLINMLVLRNDVSDDPTLEELIRRSMVTVAEGWDHQAAPFEKIIERIGLPRDPSRNPMFQIAMDLQSSTAFTWTFQDLVVEWISVAQPTARFDLAINTYDSVDGLQFRVEFATDLFDRSRVHRLMSHLELVLRAAVADPSTRVSQVPLVVGEERDRMLSDWQGQHVEQTTDPVHTQIAAIHPDVVAARFQGAELTYGELDNRAGILARHLRQLGVGHQDVVAVGLERGFDLLVALVGVLKTGAAFVVMDTSHPQQRLAFVLSDTAAKVVLTTSTLQPRLPEPDGWSPLRMDTDWATIEHAAAEPLPELADENSLAYVLYTSGSTGKPKGVMIEHHALTTFTIWLRNLFHFGPGTRMAHHMAMIFDFAVGEIFTGLVSGATLVFVPEEARLSPPALGDLLLDEHINYLGGPPAVLGAIPPHPYPELTYMIAGGEAVPPDLVNRWNTAPRRFINGYGPTEAAVGCIYHECEHRTWTEQPPIGRPMPRRVAYVFDQWDNLCPVGIPGEVVVGAAGLARGYLNLPELTAEKFIPDPLNPNQRLYRTGDLGVWNETGTIEFLGRIDTQIKLNGLRIELEEIESTLTTHPHITAAAVTVREDTPGNKQLVGYIVPTNGTINTTDLRTHLAEHLPRYMIPNIFVTLPKLPLTTIGKIDRNALPHPEQHTTTRTPITPRTPTEQTITDTFTETLGLPNISVDDNFFALGGTSLQAARTVLALREVTGRDVALTLLYTKPTIRDLAAALDESAGTTTSKAVAAVRETASPAALPPRAPTRFQHILLTGATGYFGAFLLDELLSGTDGTVTCLVRPVRGQRAADRVIANLARFGRHRDDLAERVRVREGDLTRQRLGLSEDEFARLAAQLDVIVHSGAHVDILFPYEGLEGANVDGTRRIIELATTGQLKELLLVSTVSARLGEHRDPSLPGYAASKWAAERLVVAARDRGAPASVFRLPRIAGDSRTGLSNDRDAVMGLLRRFLAMGVAADLRFEEEWVPADLGARALVASASRRSDGGLFTIDPPTRVRVNEVIALLAERAGLPVLPRAEFMDHIAARFPDQLELMKGILATGSRTDLPAPSAEVDKGFERVEAGGPDERLLRRYVDALVTSVGNQPADMK